MTLISTERNGKLAAKVFDNRSYDEFVVKFYINDVYQMHADYYASDRDDAIATARTIWNAPIKKAMKRAA